MIRIYTVLCLKDNLDYWSQFLISVFSFNQITWRKNLSKEHKETTLTFLHKTPPNIYNQPEDQQPVHLAELRSSEHGLGLDTPTMNTKISQKIYDLCLGEEWCEFECFLQVFPPVITLDQTVGIVYH